MAKKKPTAFHPKFTITPTIASGLMRIEAVKQAIQTLPITPRVLANLRETARLFSTHYPTMIEGDRLTQGRFQSGLGLRIINFAAIRPYYAGNGRTARLLTMLILHLGTYGLKG